MKTLSDQLKAFAVEINLPLATARLDGSPEDPDRAEKIRRILGVKPKFPEYRFSFGKYNSEMLEDVIIKDRKYLYWLLSTDWSEKYPKDAELIQEALDMEIDNGNNNQTRH